MTKNGKRKSADFGELRDAFDTLSDVVRVNGRIDISRSVVKASGIPRERWWDISSRINKTQDMVRYLVTGSGQRSTVRDRMEVVISVLAVEGRLSESRAFEVTALLVKGRGTIEKTLNLSSSDKSWTGKLRGFTDWSNIEAVIAAAEGNNQRAMIGLVLQLAGIGRGRLEIIETDVPEEVEEAAQSIKGADWLKAGLPRFRSAAGEALWYLMRIRSVHARMIKTRRQGYYTSFALAAMRASGLDTDEMANVTGMKAEMIERLTPSPGRTPHESANFEALGGTFLSMETQVGSDARAALCADRVWKGAAIYARILDRRIRVGRQARIRLAEGDDVVSIARDLGIARRDLIRVLSVRQDDAVAERERFVRAIIDPGLVRRVCADHGKTDETV